MKYKAIKGLTCEPYSRPVTGGSEFDNDLQKLSKELIDRAIAEGRIVLIPGIVKVVKTKAKKIVNKKK